MPSAKHDWSRETQRQATVYRENLRVFQICAGITIGLFGLWLLTMLRPDVAGHILGGVAGLSLLFTAIAAKGAWQSRVR